MKSSDLLINTNGYVLSLLEKILDANIEIKGIENLPVENPKMFVANHFTRTEAMLIPYSLYNLTGKKVGVIADDSLFKSFFGDFLTNLGAMKKSQENRNEHIIGDLITSCKDWMIFPEGMMVKAKDISKIDNNFCVKIDNTCQRVHTGATVFALTSEYLREKYYDYKLDDYDSFSKKYFINECKDINKNETMIVPINISYSKLRTGSNFLINMVERLIDEIGDNFKEELEIESNLILNSKITINILKPINTKEILKNLYKQNLSQKEIISSLRYEVTHNFMNYIYESLTINFDHIFILILFLYQKNEINIEYFKRIIYLTINEIKKANLYINDEIDKDLIYLISYEKFDRYEDILNIVLNDKILEKNKEIYIINKEVLLNSHTHNTIRIKNISRVILNEILINQTVLNIVNNILKNDENQNNQNLLSILVEDEKREFINDYDKFKNNPDIKAKEIGEPKYYETIDNQNCIIAIHGFSSSPKEVEQLSIFLNQNNFNVIAPRLDGHGIVPENLKDKTWQDWYKSISRTIIISTLKYKKIFIVGFSTGGLLGLLSTKKHYKEFQALVCINAALNLNDIRMRTLLPAISFWNDLVELVNQNKYAKEYVDNIPENPAINYNKHYVNSVEQLDLLMHKTKKNLHKIQKPIFIIQGKNDPIVNPDSAQEIYEKIKSKYKRIKLFDASNHVIIIGNKTEEVFKEILNFINKFT